MWSIAVLTAGFVGTVGLYVDCLMYMCVSLLIVSCMGVYGSLLKHALGFVFVMYICV